MPQKNDLAKEHQLQNCKAVGVQQTVESAESKFTTYLTQVQHQYSIHWTIGIKNLKRFLRLFTLCLGIRNECLDA